MENRGSAKRVAKLLRPYLYHIVLALICMVAVSGLSLILPWLVKEIIDKVLINKDLRMLNLICLLAIGIYFLKGVFSFGQRVSNGLCGTEGHL